MSRSRRKTPIVKNNLRGSKKEAARKARRTWDIDSGGAYKKVYNQYDITDQILIYTDEPMPREFRNK